MRARHATPFLLVALASEKEFSSLFPNTGAMPPFGNLWDIKPTVLERRGPRLIRRPPGRGGQPDRCGNRAHPVSVRAASSLREKRMQIRPLWLSLSLLALVAAPASLRAQKVQAGTWTGTIAPPDSEPIDFTFAVSLSGDTVRITANGEMGTFPFNDVKVLTDRITFTFEPGDTHVSCTLMLIEKGLYKGDCLDADGGTGVITMIPPKSD